MREETNEAIIYENLKISGKEKLNSDKEAILFQEKLLAKARNRIIEEESQIHMKQNELSNLKKDLAQKLSEREKIRHGLIKDEFLGA